MGIDLPHEATIRGGGRTDEVVAIVALAVALTACRRDKVGIVHNAVGSVCLFVINAHVGSAEGVSGPRPQCESLEEKICKSQSVAWVAKVVVWKAKWKEGSRQTKGRSKGEGEEGDHHTVMAGGGSAFCIPASTDPTATIPLFLTGDPMSCAARANKRQGRKSKRKISSATDPCIARIGEEATEYVHHECSMRRAEVGLSIHR